MGIRFLIDEEWKVVSLWKSARVLEAFQPFSWGGEAENGGVFYGCGDGDAWEMRHYHRKAVSPDRPHMKLDFGGQLQLYASYPAFNRYAAEHIVENIGEGMEAKKTKDLFNMAHWPCGMGDKYGMTLLDIPVAVQSARRRFVRAGITTDPHIHDFIHLHLSLPGEVRKMRTYRFFPERVPEMPALRAA